jgi:hypothetical protein
MSYSISWEKRGPFITYQGSLGFAEFMGAIMSVHCHPDYASFQYVIHDMTGTTAFDFTGVDMTTIVSHELGARFTNSRVKVAVVSQDPTMAQHTETFGKLTQVPIVVLSNVELAREWVTAGHH